MPRFIAAIDQGTTSTRCMIFSFIGSRVKIPPSAPALN
jgi:glycerol kinase